MIEPIVNWNFGKNSNIRMDQIRVNKPKKTLVNSTNTKTLVNIINPYPIKYPGPHKSHTLNNTVLDVYSSTRV